MPWRQVLDLVGQLVPQLGHVLMIADDDAVDTVTDHLRYGKRDLRLVRSFLDVATGADLASGGGG